MSRKVQLALAQLGPVEADEPREAVVPRLVRMLREAAGRGCTLVVFPELALTTFFPRLWLETEAEIDKYFETEMPNAQVAPLFEAAKETGCGFYLGYAEIAYEGGTKHYFNTSILVDGSGEIVGKYRKIHLPGRKDREPDLAWHNLEKRYFEVGNLGFPVFRAFGGIVGMALCNDRRWPETFRMLGLQGVELVLIGYNTPIGNARSATQSGEVRMLQNHISLQAGAYQNSCFVCGVAKAGIEGGVQMMGGSCVVAPSGQIIAQSRTLEDELVLADIDLDECAFLKSTTFNFAAHRRIEHYGLITSQTGAIPPV